MNLRQTFNIAWTSLHSDKTYFWQTVISILVGIVALETVLVIGGGMIHIYDAASENYTSSMFYIAAQTRAESNRRIMPEDMEQLVLDHPDLFAASSPVISVVGDFIYNGEIYDKAGILGVSATYDQILQALQLEQGRFLLPMDIAREQNVCVLGSNVAKNLQSEDILGSSIKIQGYYYKVVGIANEIKNDFDFAGWNDNVYIPYSNAQKLKNYSFDPMYYGNGGYFDAFYLGVNGNDKMKEAYSVIYDMRKQVLGEDGVMGIMSFEQWIHQQQKRFLPVVVETLIIMFLALLVAGAGIANVMFLSVSKRQKEIGIRKAFGARPKDIRRQFLFEAICISFLAGLPGVVLGIPVSYYVCKNMGLVFGISLGQILLVLLICVGIAVFFGAYPAKQAAKMEIVEAINSD